MDISGHLDGTGCAVTVAGEHGHAPRSATSLEPNADGQIIEVVGRKIRNVNLRRMSELAAVTIQAAVGFADDAVVVQIDALGWDYISFPVNIFPVETHNAVPPDTSSTLGND